MIEFILKKHSVVKASFTENSEIAKKSLELGVEGNILIPKNTIESSQIMVKLRFHLGKEEERLALALETVSIFEIVGENQEGLTEDAVQKKCLPIALANLRKTVKKVSEAYGLPSIDLVPFEGELVGE